MLQTFTIVVQLLLSAGLASSSEQLPGAYPQVSVKCASETCCFSRRKYVVQVNSGNPARLLSYKWSVSEGKIIRGQGTSSIEVTAPKWRSVTALVAVSGPGVESAITASIWADCHRPLEFRLFDQFSNISLAQENARLARFAAQLRKEPGTRGYVVVYGGSNRGEIVKKNLVAQQGIEADRIVSVEKKRGRKLIIKLYIVPVGVAGPNG